jgi:hypothetical protein
MKSPSRTPLISPFQLWIANGENHEAPMCIEPAGWEV